MWHSWYWSLRNSSKSLSKTLDGPPDTGDAPALLLLCLCQLFFGGGGYSVRGEAEFLLQFFERSRRAEGMHADTAASIAVPAKYRRLLHRNPCLHARRKHRVLILVGLLLEQLPGRHTDDARFYPFLSKFFVSIHAKRNLAAGADQNHVGFSFRRVGQHISTVGDARCLPVLRAIERRHVLTRQDQAGRFMTQLHDHAPCFGHFVGIARPQHDQPGYGPQRNQLFHRLMRGTILAHS